MEESSNDTNPSTKVPTNIYEWQEMNLEALRQYRLRLCVKICEFMEEETGVAYTLEDDLERILTDELTEVQRQNVLSKLALFQQFPSQLDADLPKQ